MGPAAAFQQMLEEGRFMIQRGKQSGRYVFYPRVAAPETGEELEWVEASGMGTVYATTTIHCRPPAADYNVALVDLAEGPRMMSRVEGVDPSDVRIGMSVKARITAVDGAALVVFDPAP